LAAGAPEFLLAAKRPRISSSKGGNVVRRRCGIIGCCLLCWVVTARIQADDALPPVVPSTAVWMSLNSPAPPTSSSLLVPEVPPGQSVSLSEMQPSQPAIVGQPPAIAPSYHSLDGQPTQSPLGRPQWTHDGPPLPQFEPDAASVVVSEAHGIWPVRPYAAMAPAGLPPGTNQGQTNPFSMERSTESPWEDEVYDRVLDLYPDGNDRQLIQRVREAVLLTEVGVDTTDEEWITVSGDGRRISWGGRIDTDTVNWARDDDFSGPTAIGQPNYVEFRRLRLMASGQGYGIYDYQLEIEFSPEFDEDRIDIPTADTFGVEIKDAFIGLRDIPWLGYTMIGHFRTPFGLESLTSSRNIPFMERSLPNRLMPGRELGIAAFNAAPELLNMTWAYGYFFEELEETQRSIIDDNQGRRFISRVTFTPYYDESSSGGSFFHTGFGYAYTRPRLIDQGFILPPAREVRFSGQPEIHQSPAFITTQTLDTQQYHLFNLELAWAHGPFTLQSEGTLAEIRLADGTSTNVWGTYVHGSWFLTGERRPYDRNFGVFQRVQPYENFWLICSPSARGAGLGAWELTTRWSHLNFSDVTEQYMHDLTVGMNWYWNPHSRLMFNWIHPMVHGSNRFDLVNTEGDILAARLQVDF
jgi:phosphate-selective porin OprO/OprP